MVDVLVGLLPTLTRARGRPAKPPPPPPTDAGAAVTRAVLGYVTQHAGCVQHGQDRQHYSDGFRHFIVDLRSKHTTLDVEAFAVAANVPLGTLKDWLRDPLAVIAAAPLRGGVVGGHAGDRQPTPASTAGLKADSAGRLPTSGQVRMDALGNREVRLDNGVTATTSPDALGGSTTRFSNGVTASSRTDALGGTTTRYSNGVTASSRKDPFGNTDTVYSDGTRSTTRVDPFGNQVTTFSDGRTETIRPDPLAPRPKDGKNDRK